MLTYLLETIKAILKNILDIPKCKQNSTLQPIKIRS